MLVNAACRIAADAIVALLLTNVNPVLTNIDYHECRSGILGLSRLHAHLLRLGARVLKARSKNYRAHPLACPAASLGKQMRGVLSTARGLGTSRTKDRNGVEAGGRVHGGHDIFWSHGGSCCSRFRRCHRSRPITRACIAPRVHPRRTPRQHDDITR